MKGKKMLLHSLKSTNDCIDLAKTLTKEQYEELEECGKICSISARKWMVLECFDIASIMATKCQFCNETIQFFKGEKYAI
jgi:hypothetical protein